MYLHNTWKLLNFLHLDSVKFPRDKNANVTLRTPAGGGFARRIVNLAVVSRATFEPRAMNFKIIRWKAKRTRLVGDYKYCRRKCLIEGRQIESC